MSQDEKKEFFSLNDLSNIYRYTISCSQPRRTSVPMRSYCSGGTVFPSIFFKEHILNNFNTFLKNNIIVLSF